MEVKVTAKMYRKAATRIINQHKKTHGLLLEVPEWEIIFKDGKVFLRYFFLKQKKKYLVQII